MAASRRCCWKTRGAKSGKIRNAILGYLEDGPDAWLVIASLGGAARQPAWLHNLAKDPHATIEFFGGHRIDVEASTLHRDDRDGAWKPAEVEAPST